MAEILKGAPVAAALNEKMSADVAALKAKGVTPTLAIFRVGERDDDMRGHEALRAGGRCGEECRTTR